MKASTLMGFTDEGLIYRELLVDHIFEMDKDRISDRLHTDGLESRLNVRADELVIGEVIVRSPENLKAHIVEVQGEASDFG